MMSMEDLYLFVRVTRETSLLVIFTFLNTLQIYISSNVIANVYLGACLSVCLTILFDTDVVCIYGKLYD